MTHPSAVEPVIALLLAVVLAVQNQIFPAFDLLGNSKRIIIWAIVFLWIKIQIIQKFKALMESYLLIEIY